MTLVFLLEERSMKVFLEGLLPRILAWYLADLGAIDAVYGTKLAEKQNTEKFRDPDRLGSPDRELGELVPEFRKTAGARLLAPIITVENTRSASFRCFVDAVRVAQE